MFEDHPHTLIKTKLHKPQVSDDLIPRPRLVRRLTEGQVSAGLHRVAFDGRDGAGLPLPAGVYFQRLVVDGHPADRGRLVLLR